MISIYLSFDLIMILLKITNASDVVASKAGKLFEKMTPEMIDQKLVESQVIQQMIEQLKLEGLEGQISSVKGLDVSEDVLITKSSFKVRTTKTFWIQLIFHNYLLPNLNKSRLMWLLPYIAYLVFSSYRMIAFDFGLSYWYFSYENLIIYYWEEIGL